MSHFIKSTATVAILMGALISTACSTDLPLEGETNDAIDIPENVDEFGMYQSSATVDKPSWLADSIVLRLDPTAKADQVASVVGGTIRSSFTLGDDTIVEMAIDPNLGVETALARLGDRDTSMNLPGAPADSYMLHNGRYPGVIYAEPNYLYQPLYIPNDPFFTTNQYGPQITNAPKAWDIEQGDPGVILAVIDTGVDYHQEFLNRLGEGWNHITNLPTAPLTSNDDGGHGSHVAGIAAAQGNDRRGMAGTAWNVTIRSLKVCGHTGCPGYAISAAIRKAADYPDANRIVINMSLGGPFYSQSGNEVNSYALKRGVSIVAASGNDGMYQVSFPAGYSGVIGTGCSNSDDRMVWFSSRGWHVDIASPGTNILSVKHNTWDRYVNFSGTSMASPYAAGYACLIRSANPYLDPTQVAEVMQVTADPIVGKAPGEWRSDQGYGRINVGNGVELARNMYENWLEPEKYTWTNSQGNDVKMTEMTGSDAGFRLGNLKVTVKIGKNYIVDGPVGQSDVPLPNQDVMLMNANRTEVLYVGRTSDGKTEPKDNQSFGVLPAGEVNFNAIPAGNYYVRILIPRGNSVEEPVQIDPGKTVSRDIIVGFPQPVVNYMIGTFPLYNNTDPDLRLGLPQDSESPTALNAYMRVQRDESGDDFSNEYIGGTWGGNDYYYSFSALPLMVPTGDRYLISLLSYQQPGIYYSRLDRSVGHYGMAVTRDLFVPISYQISDSIDALGKVNPDVAFSQTLTYYWRNPELQSWLTQQGEFKDAGSGAWIDLNQYPTLTPERITVTDRDSILSTGEGVVTGYLHLGDTDIWILDLTDL